MKVIHIPDGPANLAPLFPSIIWHNVEEYSVIIGDLAGDPVLQTPQNWITYCDENVRIFFINYLGSLDAIDFEIVNVEHENKSDQYERGDAYPVVKSDHAISRFNVKSNDAYQVRSHRYPEAAKDWLDELFDSPQAWIMQAATQGQPASYIPIVITDGKRLKIQEEDRYLYEITAIFKLSHEKSIIRN